MKLQAWLDWKNVTPQDFGARIGVARQSVDRYRRGQRVPEPDQMVAIHRETAGAVTPSDFYDLSPVRVSRRAALYRAAGVR